MTVPESVSRKILPEAVVYYDDQYPVAAEELRRGLRSLSSLSVEQFGALDGQPPEPGDGRLTLVFTETVPERDGLTDQPAIWITTTADVVTAGIDRGATAVFNWEPADGWEMLEAKLHHRLDERSQSADGDRAVPEQALQRISDGVLALDDEFRITYLNNAMASVLRDVDGDVRGDPLWEHLSRDVAERLRPSLERAMDEGVTVTTEFQTAATERWYEVTAYPSAEGLSLYGREVTERKQRETEQARYEHLVKTVGDAVYILDPAGRFTFVNDALCEMTGYDREDLLGSSVHIIKDDETVTEAEDALRDLLRKQADNGGMPIAKLDVELLTSDDERIPATDRMTLRPLSEDGEFTGTVGTLRDISRQRRRQDILSGILESTQDMMAATTTDEVAQLVVDTIREVFEFDLAAVREHDAETDQLIPVATSDGLADVMGERPAYDPGEGAVGTAYTEQRLVVREDLEGMDDGYDRGGVEIGGFCPLGERRTLSFGSSDGEGFTDDELRLVELLAETAAAAFEMVTREEELRRYEAVVEAAEDKLFTLDADGTITLATDQFATAVGYDRETLPGHDIAEFVPEEIAAEIGDLDRPSDVETDLRSQDGDRLPSRIRTACFSSAYGDGVVGTVKDLSALRSAQQAASRNRQRFTELFETLSDPVADVAYGADGAVVSRANAAFAALCDETERYLTDRPLTDVRTALPEGVAEAMAPVTTPGASVEREVTTQTGTERKQYILKTVPYESADGERAFVVLTDVTDLAQRETHLQVLHRLLRHNLRNETTVIQGYAETLLQSDTDDQVDEFAQQIFEASSSLVDASDTARTIQRVLQMDGEEVASIPVTEASAQIRDEVLDGYPEADLATVTDGTVAFSHNLLVGVEELVDNAVEHSGEGTPDVGVELADGPEPDTVTIRVSDDGPGIPESEWDVVAGEQEITQLQHTQGLGLWLVRWVVDKHSGDLTLEERADGTTVAITLPR
ncbi:PAS domain-containing protein [Halorientalis regularis]|uniref:PAS domain S-box-containing protein n=1 Tax=Halorientalis regularis TaxID=660518 RepID=A0A1G7JWH0_9EURY|nr:PAS domain-containing protein [Halorientalis regularis]SDF29297.1 PAS domain S-box-containing protein [Halorientalis regularis]